METPRVPFYLYEAFTVPHAGGWGHAPSSPESGAPVPSDGHYANQSAWPEVERDHAAVITYLDNYVGQLMALLERLNIDKETIVFFASDNGAHLEGGHDYRFFNSTGGLLGHKRSLYEGGVRSPIMVRWPGTIKAGVVSDFVWAFWDFMPTAAEIGGGQVPDGIDGVSIVPTLMGQTQPPKPYVFFTWPGKSAPSPAPPAPPAPKPHPVPPTALNGQWCQGNAENGKCKVPIAINVSQSASGYSVTVTPCPGNTGGCSGLKWQHATGTLEMVDGAANGIKITATGRDNFMTDENGTLVMSGASVGIAWKADGGADRHWADWERMGHDLWDPRLPEPLPAGWMNVETRDGRLGYYEKATGRTTLTPPYMDVDEGRGGSGYAVRVGQWKGVVGRCASDGKPSDADVFEIYNLATDPFEQHNLAGTPQGDKQSTALRAVVKAAGVSCKCFQC